MSRKDELRQQTVWRSDPHTLVKHLVYGHYLNCWMPKILQKFPSATIVDAFAGPGVYSDGPPGSPILVAKTFLEHTAHARFGTLNVLCLEQRPDRTEWLRREIEMLGPTPKLVMTVLDPGDFAARQAELAARAHPGSASTPVLWLLDPFNIKSLPFESVAGCLASRYDEAIILLHGRDAPLLHTCWVRQDAGRALRQSRLASRHWRRERRIAQGGTRQ